MTNTWGSFQLTTVANLPNVIVAFPGEHWSDGKAAVDIVPGQLIVPGDSGAPAKMSALGSRKVWTPGVAGAVDPRACLALNVVSVPDINPGSEYSPQLLPNQIVNRLIPAGQYVHSYRAGAFHLTLIKADASYHAGDLIAWNDSENAQAGKPQGIGAWEKTATAADAFFEVEEWRPLTADPTLGVLTVKTLRVQD